MPFIGKAALQGNSKIDQYVTTVGSGGQTNFTVLIEGGDEYAVYLNGVLLQDTVDYTASGTQVALGSAAVENDIVEIHVFRSFFLVDAIKNSGDTMNGNLIMNGNLTISDGTRNLDIASHDGTNGLRLGGTQITKTAEDINKLATTGKSIAMAIVFG
tara:strand:+ start:567 stop:1037 length:471 start_codon:yes stop_codon:yes gene_type:complete